MSNAAIINDIKCHHEQYHVDMNGSGVVGAAVGTIYILSRNARYGYCILHGVSPDGRTIIRKSSLHPNKELCKNWLELSPLALAIALANNR